MNYKEQLIEWVRKGLAQPGKTQTGLAKAMGGAQPRIVEILKGKREIKAAELPDMAAYLGMPPPSRKTKTIGYVGAGEITYSIDDHAQGAGLDDVDAPWGAGPNVVAVSVRGDSMEPAYHDGDIIFYDDEPIAGDLSSLVGKECIVRLADGRTYVKILRKSKSPGYWHLESHNASMMTDQVVEWAARIRWIAKRD